MVVDRGVLHAPGVDGGFGVGEGVTYGSVKASTALVEASGWNLAKSTISWGKTAVPALVGTVRTGATRALERVGGVVEAVKTGGSSAKAWLGGVIDDASNTLRKFYLADDTGAITIDGNASGVSNSNDVVDLYRAVCVREYESVMSTGRFVPAENSLEGRRFALSPEEALAYADTDISKVAILRITVDRSAIDGVADFSTLIGPFIFKNGVYTVQPDEQSELFYVGLRSISHEF